MIQNYYIYPTLFTPHNMFKNKERIENNFVIPIIELFIKRVIYNIPVISLTYLVKCVLYNIYIYIYRLF